MKIAMFTNNYKPYIGGVPISIEHLAQALRERGHRVYVFAPTYQEQEEEPDVIRYPSFPVSIAKAPVPDVLTRIFEKKVKELGIEVIHVHHPAIVGNVALYLKKKYGIPVVFTYHTRYEQYLHYIKPLAYLERRTGVIEKYLEYFCKKCDLLAAPTPGIRDYLEQKNLGTPVRVLPTGIPGECFRPDFDRAGELRRQYKKEADYLFLTVSRLAKEKNLCFQLQGLALLKEQLAERGKTFRHLLIGEGPQQEELKKLAARLGLSKELIFTGNIPNSEMKEYQAAADAFLFTSKSETQGIVVLEAMAAGNPVVALDATGVRDVVQDGKNGYLCREEASQWAGQIVKLLSDGAAYRGMSQNALSTAKKYSEDVIAKTAELYYEEMFFPISPIRPIYDIL